MSVRKQILLVGGVLAYIAAGMSGGCNAYQRPPAMSPQETALLQEPPLPYSVTVAWWDEKTKTGQSPQAYADPLAKIVSRSGAFKANRYQHSALQGRQDLIATSTGVYCNTAVIPVLTILTLGIIPTIFKDEQCEGMLLRKSSDDLPRRGIAIEVRSKRPVVMGWAAVVLGVLPGWSYGDIKDDARFAQLFRLAVIERREEIRALAGDSTAKQ